MVDWEHRIEQWQQREAALNSAREAPRQRLGQLFDADSTRAIGSLTEHVDGLAGPSSINVAVGTIDRRRVIATAHNPQVPAEPDREDRRAARLLIHAEQLAAELQRPIVRLIDQLPPTRAGEMLDDPDAASAPSGYPAWDYTVANLTQVPVATAILGPTAGAEALRAVNAHYCVMVREQAELYVATPDVLELATGERSNAQGLGSALIHARAGTIDDDVATTSQALAKIRQFLAYLPSSVNDVAPRGRCDDPPERSDLTLRQLVPHASGQPFVMRRLIGSVIDRGSFFELRRRFGRAVITGLCRLHGWPVALLAGNPVHDATWGVDEARKAEQLVDLANRFALPVVHLVDHPGLKMGTDAAAAGVLRAGARTLNAIYEARIPWCSIIVRRAYGFGAAGHSNAHRSQHRFAWPSAEWGPLPLDHEPGIERSFAGLLASAEDPAALRQEITDRLRQSQDPLNAARRFRIENMIDPARTRVVLCEFADLVARPVGRQTN